MEQLAKHKDKNSGITHIQENKCNSINSKQCTNKAKK